MNSHDQATTFIHSQLKRLTTNDYNLLVSVYIEYLENLPPVIRQKHHFDDRKIASLREKLSEFSWYLVEGVEAKTPSVYDFSHPLFCVIIESLWIN